MKHQMKMHANEGTHYQKLPEIIRYILIEENYHTQILLDACKVCEFDIEMKPPRKILQHLIRQMVYLPESLSDVLVFMGEVVGVHLFEMLLKIFGCWLKCFVFSLNIFTM